MGLHDDYIEHLLADLVAGQLDPDGEARVPRLFSERPDVPIRLEETRRDAEIRSYAHEAKKDAGLFPSDAMLATFLSGALTELERVRLEAELEGDAVAHEGLLALHREVVAAANGSPHSDVPAAPFSERPSEELPFQRCFLSRLILGSTGAVLVFISMFLPPAAALPILFLGLAAFSAWVVFRNRHFEFRVRRLHGLLPVFVLFGLGLVAGPWAVWCYFGSAAAYWHWLLLGRRRPSTAPTEELKEPKDNVHSVGLK